MSAVDFGDLRYQLLSDADIVQTLNDYALAFLRRDPNATVEQAVVHAEDLFRRMFEGKVRLSPWSRFGYLFDVSKQKSNCDEVLVYVGDNYAAFAELLSMVAPESAPEPKPPAKPAPKPSTQKGKT